MHLIYETPRLILKTLDERYGEAVLEVNGIWDDHLRMSLIKNN